MEPAGTIHYYLYFPDQPTAERVGELCRQAGHSVDVRPGATGPDWLVFITDRDLHAPGLLDEREAQWMALAEEHGGEYDGNEISVRPN